jgi:hypothetical protein
MSIDLIRAIVAQQAAALTSDPKHRRQALRLRDHLLRGLTRQHRAAWKLAATAVTYSAN